MKYSIRKNWLATYELITKSRYVLMPFIMIAFFEALALELIYFASRPPLIYAFGPIVRKFFGEPYLHYPGNLAILPKLFYGAQTIIYVFFGILLTAIAVNIVKNVRAGLPVKFKALINNGMRRYASFFSYALAVTLIMVLLGKLDHFVVTKVYRFMVKATPGFPPEILAIISILFRFMSNIILQAFIILAVPIMVIDNLSFVKSIGRSFVMALKNFFTILRIILLPFLLYLPVLFLKGFAAEIAVKTFPEAEAIITLAGIIAALFLDCFVMVSVTNFMLDKKE